jgi:hypothetical protein
MHVCVVTFCYTSMFTVHSMISGRCADLFCKVHPSELRCARYSAARVCMNDCLPLFLLQRQ